MGMDVWVNVLRMPFLCADSGPWRKMSRAWPAMSAITTSSGSTCPSDQESAWGAAEARQEKVIVGVVRKDIVVGKCWRKCWTHLQMIFVSTVLGEKSSDVEQSWGASAKLPGRRRPPHWTGRGPVKQKASCLVSWAFFPARLCWSICWTLSQLFSVITVLGDKASEVEQVPNILKVAHQHTGQEEDV